MKGLELVDSMKKKGKKGELCSRKEERTSTHFDKLDPQLFDLRILLPDLLLEVADLERQRISQARSG